MSSVAGEDKHPFYAELIRSAPSALPDGGAAMREKLYGFVLAPNPAPEITWNFEKYLVGRNGEVAARFVPIVAPEDAIIIHAIEAVLADITRGGPPATAPTPPPRRTPHSAPHSQFTLPANSFPCLPLN